MRVSEWMEVAAEMGRIIESRISESATYVVHASEEDLDAAVDVLLDNAMSHTPDGTTAMVDIEASAENASLVVEDGGPGFPEGEMAARGVGEGGSTGLGLDIARRTVERAGGTLAIGRSELGGPEWRCGSRFPRAEPARAESDAGVTRCAR